MPLSFKIQNLNNQNFKMRYCESLYHVYFLRKSKKSTKNQRSKISLENFADWNKFVTFAIHTCLEFLANFDSLVPLSGVYSISYNFILYVMWKSWGWETYDIIFVTVFAFVALVILKIRSNQIKQHMRYTPWIYTRSPLNATFQTRKNLYCMEISLSKTDPFQANSLSQFDISSALVEFVLNEQ